MKIEVGRSVGRCTRELVKLASTRDDDVTKNTGERYQFREQMSGIYFNHSFIPSLDRDSTNDNARYLSHYRVHAASAGEKEKKEKKKRRKKKFPSAIGGYDCRASFSRV